MDVFLLTRQAPIFIWAGLANRASAIFAFLPRMQGYDTALRTQTQTQESIHSSVIAESI